MFTFNVDLIVILNISQAMEDTAEDMVEDMAADTAADTAPHQATKAILLQQVTMMVMLVHQAIRATMTVTEHQAMITDMNLLKNSS